MKKILNNKKGLSPLIATILLIAFAVALGAVVMNLGRTISPDVTLGKSDCLKSRSIEILEVSGLPKMCFAENGQQSFIDFTIHNTASENIDDLVVTISCVNDVFNKDAILGNPMKPGEGRRIRIKFDSTVYGAAEQVIITPSIIKDGTLSACSDAKLVLENVRPC